MNFDCFTKLLANLLEQFLKNTQLNQIHKTYCFLDIFSVFKQKLL